MAVNVEEPAVKSKLKDRVLLDKFTALSDAPEAERTQKTGELLKLLLARQASHSEDGVCDEISYSVSRLVQGLSSQRKFARLGYSVALCQMLRTFDAVKVEHVLEYVDKKAQSQLTGQASKGEITNVYLGKIFGYLTLVHSERLVHESKQNVRQVVQDLLKIGQEKSSLQQLCMNGLIQIISQVKSKVFKKCILPQIESRFTEGWGNCTPDTLLLLIYANKYHKKYIENFLTEHWLDPQLVSEKNFTLIADVVKRSTSVYPLTHVVNDELVKLVIEHELNVVSFWKTVVRPLFDPKGLLVSKKALGLHFFDLLLPHLDTPEKVEGVIHPDVTNVLCLFSQKQEDLGNKVSNTLKKITEFVKSAQDSKLQIAVLKSLIQKPGHFHFDKRTKSLTIATVVSHLLPEARTVFVKELMRMFSGQPSWLYDKADNRTECEQWSVKELSILVTMGEQSSSWQLDILQFLFLHSFFNVKKPSSDIPHCSHHTRELPDISRKCVTDNFFKAVSKCLSQSSQGQSRATVLGNHLDVFYQLMQFSQTLVKNSDVVVLHKEMSDSVKSEWTKMLETVQKINKKRQTDDKIGENHAFELLFLHVGLQLFTEPEGAIESLQDLHVCYKKSTQRRKSKAADDGPEWIEVITELLLSMVFKGTVLSRNVAKLVLTALADHVTPQAFQLILNVLQQTSVDDGPLGLEDEEEEMDEEENDDKNDSEENDNSEEENNSESDDSDNDEEEEDEEQSDVEEEADVNVHDELKKKVKSALGDAAVDSGSDDDDEDESDLSDSEMFKLDDTLAAAFRSMRKEKKNGKEQRKQLNDFKMRVLDLISVIIKHHPTCALIKDMVFPLLDLMEGGQRKEEQKMLGKKATEVFDLLYRVKKILPDSTLARDELLDMVSKLIQYSHKVSTDDNTKEVAKASLLVIRILLNIHDNTGPSPLKTRSKAKVTAAEKKEKEIKDHDYFQEKVVHLIQASLHKLLHKTEGKQSPVFVQTIIERYPLMFWSLSDELLSTVGDMNMKVYQKTQACGLLASLINKQLVAEIGVDSWKDFLGVLQEKSSKILSSLTQETYKTKLMKELLTIYGKISNISVEDCRQVLGEAGLQQIDKVKPEFNTDIRALYKKVTKPLRQRQESSPEGKKKKKKRNRSTDRNEDNDSKGATDNNSSPTKIPKPDETDNLANGNVIEKCRAKDLGNGKSRETKMPNITVATEGSLEEEKADSKIKHQKRKHSKSLNDSGNSINDKISGNETNHPDDSVENKEREENRMEMETSKSSKQNRKRKSSELGVSIKNTDGKKELKAEDGSRCLGEKDTDIENNFVDETLMNSTEDEIKSAKKKKHKKRKSTEHQETVNGAKEDNLGKSVHEVTENKDIDLSTLDKESVGAMGDDIDLENLSPKKKKHKHRDTQAGEMKAEKGDKFSPRYTRSMKTK